MKSFGEFLISIRRSLPVTASLLLAACASTDPKGQPVVVKSSSKDLSPPALTQVSRSSTSLPAFGLPTPTLPGQAKFEESEAATKMDTVQVNEPKLAGYHFHVIMAAQALVSLERPTPRFPDAYFWTEPGYDGYQVVTIEGKSLAQLSWPQFEHLVQTLPEPMHIAIRSSSGRIVQMEAFHSSDPRIGIKPSSGRMAPPTK